MAIPIRDFEWEARKEEAKKLIAAGGCSAIKFWSNTDALRLCPEEHKKEVKFEPLEGMVYISEWEDAAKKAIELINRGLALIAKKEKAREQPSPTIEPETTNLKYFIEDLRNGKWLKAIHEEYVHSYKYGTLSGGDETKWTSDPNEALAFNDKVEADKFYDQFYSFMPDFAVTEHEFISGIPAPTKEPAGEKRMPDCLVEHWRDEIRGAWDKINEFRLTDPYDFRFWVGYKEAIENALNKYVSVKTPKITAAPDPGPLSRREEVPPEEKNIVEFAAQYGVTAGSIPNAINILKTMKAYADNQLSSANKRIADLEKELTENETYITDLKKQRDELGARINELEERLTAAKTCLTAETQWRKDLETKIQELNDWIRSHH